MPKYIYIITLFNDTQFISSKLNKLAEQFNTYCIDNEIYTLYKDERVIMKLTPRTLGEIASKRVNCKYPFKNIEKYHCYEYFKDEMIKRFPKSFDNEPLRCYYVRKICQEKGL